MKKLLFTAAAVFAFGFTNAQKKGDSGSDKTSEGKFLIEANTGSATTGNTAISFTSDKGGSSLNFGVEGGYFIMDNLALKAGIGIGSDSPKGGSSSSSTSYKIGAQYYVMGNIPVGIDYTGYSTTGFNASYVGLEGGYAISLGDNVAVTPKLRYNNSLDTDKANSSFQGLVGFTLFF